MTINLADGSGVLTFDPGSYSLMTVGGILTQLEAFAEEYGGDTELDLDHVTLTIQDGESTEIEVVDADGDGKITIDEMIASVSAYADKNSNAVEVTYGSSLPLILAGAALAVVLIAAAVLAVLGKKGKGPMKKFLHKDKPQAPSAPSPVPAPEPYTVEKLHEQGARSSQQDSFYVSEETARDNLLVIVADGMGGLSDGDKVSQTAVTAAAQGFYSIRDNDPERVLLSLLQRANRAVNDLLGSSGIYQSGSTMVAGLIRSRAFYYVSVGDSRIYLYRGGTLYQLNREHVYRDELYLRAINEGGTLAGADAHPRAKGLSSFLGMGELKYVDIPAQPVDIHPGDRFLLMSDGVYNALSEAEIASALDQGPGLAAQLLNTAIRAKNYQNQDNYTAVIITCGGAASAQIPHTEI